MGAFIGELSGKTVQPGAAALGRPVTGIEAEALLPPVEGAEALLPPAEGAEGAAGG